MKYHKIIKRFSQKLPDSLYTFIKTASKETPKINFAKTKTFLRMKKGCFTPWKLFLSCNKYSYKMEVRFLSYESLQSVWGLCLVMKSASISIACSPFSQYENTEVDIWVGLLFVPAGRLASLGALSNHWKVWPQPLIIITSNELTSVVVTLWYVHDNTNHQYCAVGSIYYMNAVYEEKAAGAGRKFPIMGRCGYSGCCPQALVLISLNEAGALV